MEEAKHRIELIKSMLFPIVLFASILWSILVSSLIFNPLPGMGIESNIPSVNILATIILTVPVILVALLLRWLAVRFDTPPKKDMETI